MVKADLTQDYYGDLELQPGADINEIKKQFKKLALRYHPDRNPGRESEVNSRFQTIQAAHEVLTDPEQRAKYDAGMSGRRAVPTYGSCKPGNPYAAAGSQWAPPPKPHGTPRAQPTASAGSSRYSSWKAPPTFSTARKPVPGSTEAKNASTAWDQMKHPTSKARSGDIPKSGRAESNAFKHTPPPKYDRTGREGFRNGETPGTRPVPKPPIPKRPNGWNPGQAGDEPPAANTSSYNTTQYKDRAAPPLPTKPAPYEPHNYSSRTIPKHVREPRASTPYSVSGGEKTNPFEGVNMSREGYSGSNRPNSEGPARGSRTQAHGGDEMFGSPPKRTHSHADFSPSPCKGPFGSRRSARHNSVPYAHRTPKAPQSQADTSSEDESDNDDPNQPWQPKLRKFATPRARSFKFASMSSEARNANPGAGTRTNDTYGSAGGNDKTQQWDKPIFSPFSTRPHIESERTYFSNISADNINTKFSTVDWQGKFEAGDYFKADEQGRSWKTPSRAQSTGSKTRERSSTKSRSPSRPQTGCSSHASDINTNFSAKFASTSNGLPVESPGGTRFSAAEWEKTFRAQTFAPPPPSPSPFGVRSSVKNTRSSTFGRPAIITKTAGQKAAMVESPETSEGENIYKGRSSRSSSEKSGKSAPMPASAEPMDIDSPAENPNPLATHEAGFAAFAKAAGEPRNVHVEPSRAEWRTGNTNGTNNIPVKPEVAQEPSPAIPRRPAPEAKTAPEAEANRDDLDFDFKDLENTEPIHNPAKGLESFGDLGSAVPFPSQASNRTIFRTNVNTEELELPNPPKAPQVPTATDTATRPSPASWCSYLASFKAYMAEWDIFNTAMLSHFVARKQQADSMPANWLESRDDQWIELYRKGCKEDVRVREWCNVACERHANAMQSFASFRIRMKDMKEKEVVWGDGLRKSMV